MFQIESNCLWASCIRNERVVNCPIILTVRLKSHKIISLTDVCQHTLIFHQSLASIHYYPLSNLIPIHHNKMKELSSLQSNCRGEINSVASMVQIGTRHIISHIGTNNRNRALSRHPFYFLQSCEDLLYTLSME